jgi:virginiamycin B lyase
VIAAGPDRALCFTCGTLNDVGRITTGGIITYNPVPNHGDDFLAGITRGSDWAIWFTEGTRLPYMSPAK